MSGFVCVLQEVELCRMNSQEKLGLTLCYRTDEDEDAAIFVGQVGTLNCKEIMIFIGCLFQAYIIKRKPCLLFVKKEMNNVLGNQSVSFIVIHG